MFNRHLMISPLKLNRLATLFLYKNATKSLNTLSGTTVIQCLCGHAYLRSHVTKRKIEIFCLKPFLRVHSTHSDQRRQKAVIETSAPKIVIEKASSLGDKVLPQQSDAKVAVWRSNVDPYIKLMRLDKPIGIWLLYWPCAWSIALGGIAAGTPLPTLATTGALFLAGAALLRSAGCTINDLWDQDIDARVERTKDRPLVTGAITKRQAVALLAAQLSAGLVVLLQLNWYSVVLGASSMVLVVTYPLAKRFTNYPQLFLGATFNWGALLGYSAVTGGLAPAALCLYSAAAAWTVLYDTIYAHQDKIDDRRIGIKSTALSFGEHSRPALAAAAAAAGALFAGAGHAADLEWPFHAALLGALGHAGHQIYTLQPDNPADCASKFKSNTWIGLIIFAGIVAGGYNKYLDNRQKNSAGVGASKGVC